MHRFIEILIVFPGRRAYLTFLPKAANDCIASVDDKGYLIRDTCRKRRSRDRCVWSSRFNAGFIDKLEPADYLLSYKYAWTTSRVPKAHVMRTLA